MVVEIYVKDINNYEVKVGDIIKIIGVVKLSEDKIKVILLLKDNFFNNDKVKVIFKIGFGLKEVYIIEVGFVVDIIVLILIKVIVEIL